MKESGDNLNITAGFYGGNYPSTETFVQDQSGTRFFLVRVKNREMYSHCMVMGCEFY